MSKIQSGKLKLIILLCIVMAIQIRVIVSYLFYVGADRLNGQLFRAAILAVLCILTYQKRSAAKWVLIGWFIFNTVVAVFDPVFTTNYILMVMVAVYAFIPMYLLFSSDISAYLQSGKHET